MRCCHYIDIDIIVERKNAKFIEKIMPMVNFFEEIKHTGKTRLNCWEKKSAKSSSSNDDSNSRNDDESAVEEWTSTSGE